MDRLSILASHFGQHVASARAAARTGAAAGQRERHVLVVGGTGLIGRSAAEHFVSLGCRVTTISRRPLPFSLPGASHHAHLELDLSDREACKSAVNSLPPVTDLVYAAMGTTAADADPSNGTAIDVGDKVSGGAGGGSSSLLLHYVVRSLR